MGRQEEVSSGQSRRAFVGGALVAGAAAVASGGLASSALGATRPRYAERNRVDVHAHHLPPAYLEALKGAGITSIGGIPIPEWSPETALNFMDAYGIRFQMLSMSDPGVGFLQGDDAAALARTCNDYVAGVVKANPKRFGAFAVMPPDVPAAIDEVKRCYDTLKVDGIGLLSSHDGKYLGDPVYEPLLAELNRRRAWVFVHPTAVKDDDRPAYGIPNFVTEYPFDTTRTIASLLFSAAFKRYPRIRWHFAHGGGTVAMLRFRLSALADGAKQFGVLLGLSPNAAQLVKKDAAAALEAAYFDTALIADGPSLAALKEMTPVEHIMFGSDWPFANRLYPGKGDPAPALSESFGNDDRHAIERLNGVREFRRLRGLVPTT